MSIESRKQVVEKYLKLRETQDDGTNIIKLFTNTGILIDIEGNNYSGNQLNKYYQNNPPPFILPSVSEQMIDSNKNINITLTFAYIKSIDVKFEFEHNTNLISKLTLTKSSYF